MVSNILGTLNLFGGKMKIYHGKRPTGNLMGQISCSEACTLGLACHGTFPTELM